MTTWMRATPHRTRWRRATARRGGRLVRFGERSTISRTTGDEAHELIPAHSLDFVDIDARDDHDAVKRDLETWLPLMRPGGL